MTVVEDRALDHLVLLPDVVTTTFWEAALINYFCVMLMAATRFPLVRWKWFKQAYLGVGAFNLLRRDALAALGGLAPQRLSVLEDITLARRVKAAGMRQRIAFAPGLVLVHWAAGAHGLMRVMTKNLFSAFNFRPALALGACLWIVVFCLAPLVGLAWWGTAVQGLLVMLCVSVTYRLYGEASSIPARFGWTYPLGAVAFLYALLRSMVVVWKDRGVKWRGTLYPLRELRRWNSPLQWKRK